MAIVSERDVDNVEYEDLRPVKDRFPRIVIIILLTEFCERFSYSGMKAFLTLYLRSKLGYSDDGATETYHVFTTFVYVFPIIGGILSDNYLGKFRTILYMMFVYAAGNLLVAITAIPQLAMPARLCTLLGLFMITIGTGGIKPCVTAFGGDQFILPKQEHHLAVYFSVFYFTLCTGSLIAKSVSPILRSEVHCFGEKDCYSLAFGAPGLIVLVSIVTFVSAKSKYVIKKPEGNVVVSFVKCVSLGIKNAILKRDSNEKTVHWLDTTQHEYDRDFIRDVKKTLSILMLFTVVPVFWSLLDQMGSRWTLQATKMDGRLGFVTIKPDQMQVLSPIFILILIPLAQKYIYPYLEQRNILKNPLHKLTLGGILAGIAFIASGFVEIYIKTTYPNLPQEGLAQLRIFNGNSCPITIENTYHNFTHTITSLSAFTKTDIPAHGAAYLSLKLKGACIKSRKARLLIEENKAISFFLTGNDVIRYQDNVDKSKAGFPFVRFLVSTNATNVTLINERHNETESFFDALGVSKQLDVSTSTYSLRVNDKTTKNHIDIESGGVYAIMVGKVGGSYKSKLIVITEPNSITMAWLLPQFFIISIGEVLYAITGIEFAFKEAPDTMKAVMSAAWLLTEATGNIIIIVITRLFVNYTQETQFFIYTGLMFASVIVFQYLARGYQFGRPDLDDDVPKKEHRSNSEELYLQVKQTEDCLDH